MSDDIERSVHSARAAHEILREKARIEKKQSAALDKRNQLEQQNTALLKGLIEKAHVDTELKKENKGKQKESNQIDVVEVKPSFFGVSINFNEIWRRIKTWRSKKNT